jgi:hypothetical protein
MYQLDSMNTSPWNFSEPPEFTAALAQVVILWFHSSDV